MSAFLASARRGYRSSCQRHLGALTAVNTARALHVSARACCAPASSGPGDRAEPGVFVDPRPRILAAALNHVNREGWTQEALAAGARDVGYPSVAQGMFEGGAIELVHDFMRRSNVAMSLRLEQTDLAPLSANERIATAVRFRLEHLAPYVRSWPQAMAMGLLPHNVGGTATILAEMSDEMWWHAGDRSTDLNWYTRRALLVGVYAATETFMLTDRSPGFAETWSFLDRRLADVAEVGQRAGESLSVAQAVAGGVASLGLAAFEIVRPAALAGGTVLGAGLNAAQSAVSGVAGAASRSMAGAAAGAVAGPGMAGDAAGGLPNINVGGLPLGSVLSAAGPVVAEAARAVEGIASRFNIPLPPMLQILTTAMAASGGAATAMGAPVAAAPGSSRFDETDRPDGFSAPPPMQARYERPAVGYTEPWDRAVGSPAMPGSASSGTSPAPYPPAAAPIRSPTAGEVAAAAGISPLPRGGVAGAGPSYPMPEPPVAGRPLA